MTESLPLAKITFLEIIWGVIVAEPKILLSTVGVVEPNCLMVSVFDLKLSSLIALISNVCGMLPAIEVSPHAPLYDKQTNAESKPALLLGSNFVVSPAPPK